MCGIAGFLGGFAEPLLGQMARRIAHRGPDDHGFFHDGETGVGFAHRRLSIIDLSATGHQPMVDQSDRFVICYNGEVYNSPELRAELLAMGVTLRGTSDTEVILELLARRGLGELARLNGIFALGLWDKHRRELHLVRDGLGIKPLYWTQTTTGFAFASELKALLEVPDLSRELDQVAAVAYVSYLYSPGERTMFQHVKKLGPGTCVTLSLSSPPRVSRFYSLPDPDPVPIRPEAAVDQMREMLDQAVRRQLLADVEVGAFLSGGLDSTSIVALARSHVPGGRLPCFTINYAARKRDERELVSDLPYAREAARHLGVDLHEVRVDASMADDFEELVYMLDEPQADPAALNNYYISRLARESGIKVLLSGAGGDDLLTGYRRHRLARYDDAVSGLPQSVRKVIGGLARQLPPAGNLARRVRKALCLIDEDSVARIERMFEWLAPEYAAALLANIENTDDLAQSARKPMLDAAAGQGSGLDRVMRLDQLFFLTDHNLNYTDKTGMAAGVEIRVPFLDIDLIDWASRLPADIKLRGGQTKWPLRQAMASTLPKSVIDRPKTGFGVPLRSWMRDELRPVMDDLLAPQTVAARGLFSPEAVTGLRADTESGRVDGSYPLLAIAAIELWCQRFVDQ